VDDAMAQKVVAQRLVIRKLHAMHKKHHVVDDHSDDVSMNTSGHSTASPVGQIVSVPIEDLEDIPMDGDGKSPRNVKSFMPPESPILDDYTLDALPDDNTVMKYLQTGSRSTSNRSWGSSFRSNPQSS
jgi:hypothetical protein